MSAAIVFDMHFKRITLLILVTCVTNSDTQVQEEHGFSLLSLKDSHKRNDNENLYNSINIIINKGFLIRRILIYANYNNSSREETFYFHDFVENILDRIENFDVKILFQQQKILRNSVDSEILLFADIESLE